MDPEPFRQMYLVERICICICIWIDVFVFESKLKKIFVFVFEKSKFLYLYLYLIKRIWPQPWALPSFPPTWASVICVTSLTLSFMIRSYTFPTLLARVIPLSLEHFPFWPLLLYSLMILPLSHDLGMLSSSCTLLIILVKVLVVYWLASRNTVFHLGCHPVLSFPFFWVF